jgi:hypothetical protein
VFYWLRSYGDIGAVLLAPFCKVVLAFALLEGVLGLIGVAVGSWHVILYVVVNFGKEFKLKAAG